jgi:tetratricopeptide (TPR) repeat protein
LGETRRAIELYEEALSIAREIGDRRGEARHLWNMGQALDKLGDRAQAVTHAEAALRLFEQVENPYSEIARKQLADWRKADEARRQLPPASVSPPHPAADPERASHLNIQYQKGLAVWRALPWLKRVRTPKPRPPTGI